MTVYHLRVFLNINGTELNTVDRLFNNLSNAEEVQTAIHTAATLLGINDYINVTIMEITLET